MKNIINRLKCACCGHFWRETITLKKGTFDPKRFGQEGESWPVVFIYDEIRCEHCGEVAKRQMSRPIKASEKEVIANELLVLESMRLRWMDERRDPDDYFNRIDSFLREDRPEVKVAEERLAKAKSL